MYLGSDRAQLTHIHDVKINFGRHVGAVAYKALHAQPTLVLQNGLGQRHRAAALGVHQRRGGRAVVFVETALTTLRTERCAAVQLESRFRVVDHNV